jgi:hypothetical protein
MEVLHRFACVRFTQNACQREIDNFWNFAQPKLASSARLTR